MLRLEEYERVYLLGIGGIGMSALARFFNSKGMQVAGYDRTETALTKTLAEEGIMIHYTDHHKHIPTAFRHPSPGTLVIYTPALPSSSQEMSFFRAQGHELHKRAEILGMISRAYRTIAVAGTHGKTTTTCILAHLLHETVGCTAFLGGIATNFQSNLVLDSRGSDLLVAEADEYDRSFLQLSPSISAITSLSPDHMDIYETYPELIAAFQEFALLGPGRRLIVNQRVASNFRILGLELLTYGFEDGCTYQARDVRHSRHGCSFTLVARDERLKFSLNMPGLHNVENALCAIACAAESGVRIRDLVRPLFTFRGVHRRFNILYQSPHHVLIDDYAHHPDEITAAIHAARTMFPKRRLTGIFQPHLYSRTRDLMSQFAFSLSGFDSLILLPIYPAREEAIEGVSSEVLLTLIPPHIPRLIATFEQLEQVLRSIPSDVILAMGAGDIGAHAPQMAEVLSRLEEEERT